MTKTQIAAERRMDQEAARGNRRVHVHARALELLRQGQFLLMVDAVRYAEREYTREKGGR